MDGATLTLYRVHRSLKLVGHSGFYDILVGMYEEHEPVAILWQKVVQEDLRAELKEGVRGR